MTTESEIPKEQESRRGTRLFQIKEDDLAELERIIPDLCSALYPQIDNRLRSQLRRAKSIVSDVGWNYGPPLEVIVLPNE